MLILCKTQNKTCKTFLLDVSERRSVTQLNIQDLLYNTSLGAVQGTSSYHQDSPENVSATEMVLKEHCFEMAHTRPIIFIIVFVERYSVSSYFLSSLLSRNIIKIALCIANVLDDAMAHFVLDKTEGGHELFLKYS